MHDLLEFIKRDQDDDTEPVVPVNLTDVVDELPETIHDGYTSKEDE